MSEARKKAVECLIRCERGGYSNLVLMQELSGSGMDARDRAFCTSLVYGTLSRKLTLDAVIASCLSRPISRLDTEVLVILRTGAYQLFWMDSVPDRAAINESVELCRAFRKSSASGLVNAVLRKCSGIEPGEIVSGIEDADEMISVKYSINRELVLLLEEQYADETESVLGSLFGPSDIFLRVNTLMTDTSAAADALLKEGIRTETTDVPGCLRVLSGFTGRSELMDSGMVRVQSLPAQYAVFAASPGPGTSVLDMCAAPGGKTMTMAQHMRGEGSITAVDSAANRLRLVGALAEKEHVSIVETVLCDAAQFETERRFDTVLCDVPCSGYGEIASKPELRYRSPSGSAELPEIQYSILCNGARLTADGGTLLYSTCTLLKRENEEIVKRFLESHPGFSISVPRSVPSSASVSDGMVSFVPGRGGQEGFFIAVMIKM